MGLDKQTVVEKLEQLEEQVPRSQGWFFAAFALRDLDAMDTDAFLAHYRATNPEQALAQLGPQEDRLLVPAAVPIIVFIFVCNAMFDFIGRCTSISI